MIFEMLMSCVMGYPSLYGETYEETANDFSNGKYIEKQNLLNYSLNDYR